jgi:hypothetical protein
MVVRSGVEGERRGASCWKRKSAKCIKREHSLALTLHIVLAITLPHRETAVAPHLLPKQSSNIQALHLPNPPTDPIIRMQITNILTLVAALTAAGVSGADIFRTSRDMCGGSKVGCKGIQEDRCCKFSRPVRQILYTLPDNSRGIAYSDDDCHGGSIFFRAPKKGTFCRAFDRNSKPLFLPPPFPLSPLCLCNPKHGPRGFRSGKANVTASSPTHSQLSEMGSRPGPQGVCRASRRGCRSHLPLQRARPCQLLPRRWHPPSSPDPARHERQGRGVVGGGHVRLAGPA